MRLLSRMIGGEALRGIRVEHAWRRKPPLGNRDHAFPRHPTLLTATAQNVPPHAKHPFPEHAEAVQIPGYCVVVEVALHNCAERCACSAWKGQPFSNLSQSTRSSTLSVQQRPANRAQDLVRRVRRSVLRDCAGFRSYSSSIIFVVLAPAAVREYLRLTSVTH